MSALDYLEKWKSKEEIIKKVVAFGDYETERLQECVEGLFTFAKFKVGERVQMAETYPVNEKDSWGWMSCKHLLKLNSKATVREVDWIHGQFTYLVEFDEKTYFDSTQKEVLPASSSTRLCLSENWLKRDNGY